MASGAATTRPGRGRGRMDGAAPDCEPRDGDVDWGPIGSAPSRPSTASAWCAMVDSQILTGETHAAGWMRKGGLL